MESTEETPLKITFIGDGAVGKTCVVVRFAQYVFPTSYNPTVFDTYTYHWDDAIDGVPRKFDIAFWDTAGQEEYENLRTLTYPGTDIFVICFSVVERTSFDNTKLLWMKDIAGRYPGTPVVLLGTKTDLRGKETLSERKSRTG